MLMLMPEYLPCVEVVMLMLMPEYLPSAEVVMLMMMQRLIERQRAFLGEIFYAIRLGQVPDPQL